MRRLSIMLLILLVIQVLFLVPASTAGVSKDSTDSWRINTYPAEEMNHQHLVFGQVFVPRDNDIYKSGSGYADTAECGMDVAELRVTAQDLSYRMMDKMLGMLGRKKYIISMTVSVCHPEWFVVYLTIDMHNASKEVYNKVFEALQ